MKLSAFVFLALATLSFPAFAEEVSGKTVLWPTLPVVQADDPGLDYRPLPGMTVAVLNAGGEKVAEQTSDERGEFHLELTPGQYTLQITSCPQFGGTPSALEVKASQPAELTLICDSGMR